MKDRYRIFRRNGGTYYARDTVTMKKESLGTQDLSQARRLIAAKNQAVEQPSLNKSMAKAYLSATSPEFTQRTWTDVMEMYVKSGVESTRDRKERAFRSRPFAMLRPVKIIETEAIHLFTVLEHKKAGNSTYHYLKRLHNFALHLGWLLAPVMAEAAWPTMRRKKFEAIPEDEHQRIIERENNPERRLFYQLLWETGGSQTDIATLSWKNVDLENRQITFSRRKLEGKGDGLGGGASCLYIGSKLQTILDQLPQTGYFFPIIRQEEPKHRAAEFKRRCRTLKIESRVLHSYRYAWAQRARAAGMPERDAMNHLGHKSRAIHAAYGRGALTATLPIEHYETEKAKKIIEFQMQPVLAESVR
ncbi:Phage integrase family protein [Verrucomicrobium sp. GAS474]|uniref:tyrosine-type recombinase/integrase n=1 Tax=Verrucomicrobium sp. GAS474 TaxID=1882831 RepID=UPI00087D7B59|nr:tyrosine-type recombinase/integrase [Verrucomicrobium sp. GAS474]SDT91054.1 Phage integrase family protein [Verrucomicrobium sp. GAS474]